MLKLVEKVYKEIIRGKEKEGYRRDVDSRRERFMKSGESDRGRRGGFMRFFDDNDSGYNRQRYFELGGNDLRLKSWRRERLRLRERRRFRFRERGRLRERDRLRLGLREKRLRLKERILFRLRDSEKGFLDRLKNRFMRLGEGNLYVSDNRERVRFVVFVWKKKEFYKLEFFEREERDMKRFLKELKKRGYLELLFLIGIFIGKLIFYMKYMYLKIDILNYYIYVLCLKI